MKITQRRYDSTLGHKESAVGLNWTDTARTPVNGLGTRCSKLVVCVCAYMRAHVCEGMGLVNVLPHLCV